MADREGSPLTIKGLLLGVVLAAILAAANAYLGLFAGMTVSASIPAAVVSMAVLRAFRHHGILENNIVQTMASAGEALAAGVIFTLPALVIMGDWPAFDYAWVVAIAGLGGVLGVLFTVPLRRSLIVEQQLPFPEGAATAEVLRTAHGASGGVRPLAAGAAVAALAKLAASGLRLWPASAELAGQRGRTVAYGGLNLSPALLAVGYIVGVNIAVLVFAGGALSWLVAIPLFSAMGWVETGDGPAAQTAYRIWSDQIRFIGVGAMLVGGLWALASMLPSLARGVRDGLRAHRATGSPMTERDLPMGWVLGGVAVLVLPVYGLYQLAAGSAGPGLGLTALMILAGFLFAAVAAYMAGMVGSSNNPVSGVTIATILLAALLLLALMGPDATQGPAAAILVGAVVACAAAIGGDTTQDLKAGYLLGATPWHQQLVQIAGVAAAMLVMAPVLNLLLEAYGLGAPTAGHPDPLAAPQATLMASVAQGVFGYDLPWPMVAVGALLGGVIIAFDLWLKRRGSAWRAPVLAVAVGLYLPLELSVTIAAGGGVAALAQRRARSAGAAESASRRGVLLAAGLITGEALMGILLAVPVVLAGEREVLGVVASPPLGPWPGLVVMAALGAALYRVAGRVTAD